MPVQSLKTTLTFVFAFPPSEANSVMKKGKEGAVNGDLEMLGAETDCEEQRLTSNHLRKLIPGSPLPNLRAEQPAPEPLLEPIHEPELQPQEPACPASHLHSQRLQPQMRRHWQQQQQRPKYDDDEEDNALKESGEWAQRQRRPSAGKPGRSLLLPTSWNSRASTTTTTTQSRSSVGTRTSTSSVGLSFSLEVTIPDGDRAWTPSRIRKPGARSSGGGRDSTGSSLDQHPRPLPMKRPSGDELNAPSSTASMLSIPMPTTLKDDFKSIALTMTPVSGSKKRVYDKEKSLPPLPAGGLKKMPSNSSRTQVVSSGSAAGAATGKYAFPRAQTFSSTSSASTPLSPSAVLSPLPSPSVRPLQLPHQAA
ncbi:hypothetical protein BDZ97DRAFT_1923559 [Flammula alnicola]|nr:hypothetical protein BDZ97DRAFT_1923559 [Flammula alnicola]